jgi:hypothetical protein
MLTDLERNYLRNRDSLEDDKQKKNLNHRIKTKLKLIDETLSDLRLIFEKYPEELIREYVSTNTVNSATSTLDRILQILDPWAIGEHEEGKPRAFRVWGSTIPDCEPGKCTIKSASRGVSEEETRLNKLLKEHFNKIRFYIDPCIPDPVCRDTDYIKIQMELLLKGAKDTGTSLSFDGYFDETGVDERLWITRAPSMIDVNQLQKMRWKPQGLKECMKQPPLLREIRIPGKCSTEASISLASSTSEEIEKFTEIIQKQNEGPKLTEKELLEVNERIKKIPRPEEK